MEITPITHMTDGLLCEHGRGDPFAAAISATRVPVLITDPRLPDNPIVYVNDSAVRMTGYSREEMVGSNCRMFQGPSTDKKAIQQIREAIDQTNPITIDILNYRKNGTKYWNALYISPVFTDSGELQYYFASQLDITDRIEALAAKTALLHEVDHRVKNNLQMISSLISMHIRNIPDPKVQNSLESMLRRINSLSNVHQRIYKSDTVTRFSVNDFLPIVVRDLIGTTGRTDIEVTFDLIPLTVSAQDASCVALMVNELLTNVLKHAFADFPGELRIGIEKASGDLYRIVIEDDGIGMEESSPGDTISFGMNLVQLLAGQVSATVSWEPVLPTGTRVVIALPVPDLPAPYLGLVAHAPEMAKYQYEQRP